MAIGQDTATVILVSALDTEIRSPRLFVLLFTLMCSAKNFSYASFSTGKTYKRGHVHNVILQGLRAIDREFNLLSNLYKPLVSVRKRNKTGPHIDPSRFALPCTYLGHDIKQNRVVYRNVWKMIKGEIPAVISMCIIPYSILAYQCCDSHSVN